MITNPPFYGAGTAPADPGRATALQARTPLPDWVRAAARRLNPGGVLTMILGTPMLPGALAGLGPLGSVRILPLAARPGAEPTRLILRATKGGRAEFRLLPPLILHDGKAYSAESLGILREAASIDAHFRGKPAAQPERDVTG